MIGDATDYWYLATPYSKFPDGPDAAFREACRAAAVLIRNRMRVFCPIAHSHPIAMAGDIAVDDYKIWLPADAPFMNNAVGLIVVKMKGWDKSHGIDEEIRHFREQGKPVMYMEWGGGGH